MAASEGGGAGGWGAVTEGESGSGFTSGIARSDEAGIVQDYTFACAADYRNRGQSKPGSE